MKSFVAVNSLLVERLDSLDVQHALVLELLLADLAPPWLFGVVVLVGRPRVCQVAGGVCVVEVGELVLGGQSGCSGSS